MTQKDIHHELAQAMGIMVEREHEPTSKIRLYQPALRELSTLPSPECFHPVLIDMGTAQFLVEDGNVRKRQYGYTLKSVPIFPWRKGSLLYVMISGGTELDDFQYPIGKFARIDGVTVEQRNEWIQQIADAPAQLKSAVARLSAEQMDTPYRPEGWTVRQVLHHLPDSHMNSYIRFKLALTEENPIVKPYMEDRWARLDDYRATPVEVSLTLLESLHERWTTLLLTLQDSQFLLTFTNPESGDTVSLETAVGLYAWHGRHHIAQIMSLRQRMGWL